MTENEMIETVDQTIQEIKADSIRDMGKVMGVLKQKHAGIMDFSRAGARAKEVLSKK